MDKSLIIKDQRLTPDDIDLFLLLLLGAINRGVTQAISLQKRK